MTKHRDVNKCRQKEKCKMDALIRQANKWVQHEMANKPETRKNAWWKRRGKERKTLSEKKEEARHVSEQQDKGWIYIIRVHDTTHLAEWQHSRATDAHKLPHTKKEWAGSLQHRDYPPPPPHLYIINEWYNSRNKRASQEKKQWMARTGN